MPWSRQCALRPELGATVHLLCRLPDAKFSALCAPSIPTALNLEDHMRLASMALIGLLLACGKADEAPSADSSTLALAPAAGVDLASLAGTWTLRTTPDGRDTVITSEIAATGTTEGWTMTMPGQQPVPVRVRVDGDSIMTETGPFPSVLREGAMVTTSAVYRVQDGKLVGTLVARYGGTGADSVMTGRQEATRH